MKPKKGPAPPHVALHGDYVQYSGCRLAGLPRYDVCGYRRGYLTSLYAFVVIGLFSFCLAWAVSEDIVFSNQVLPCIKSASRSALNKRAAVYLKESTIAFKPRALGTHHAAQPPPQERKSIRATLACKYPRVHTYMPATFLLHHLYLCFSRTDVSTIPLCPHHAQIEIKMAMKTTYPSQGSRFSPPHWTAMWYKIWCTKMWGTAWTPDTRRAWLANPDSALHNGLSFS